MIDFFRSELVQNLKFDFSLWKKPRNYIKTMIRMVLAVEKLFWTFGLWISFSVDTWMHATILETQQYEYEEVYLTYHRRSKNIEYPRCLLALVLRTLLALELDTRLTSLYIHRMLYAGITMPQLLKYAESPWKKCNHMKQRHALFEPAAH